MRLKCFLEEQLDWLEKIRLSKKYNIVNEAQNTRMFFPNFLYQSNFKAQTDHKYHQGPEHNLEHCPQGNKYLYQEVHLVNSKPYRLVDDTEYSCMIHIPKNEIGWLVCWFKKHNCSEEIILCYLLSNYSSSMNTTRIKSKMKSNSKKKS